MVTNPGNLSIQLTAVGGPAALWVESQDLEQVVVRGTLDVEFHYFVNGVRRGFEDPSCPQLRPSPISRREADFGLSDDANHGRRTSCGLAIPGEDGLWRRQITETTRPVPQAARR